MNHNQNYGKIGEEIAKQYLLRNGYEIVHKNYHIGRDEVDLIAEHNNNIIFVEVKTRLSSSFGLAEYHFSHKKICFLRRSSWKYCAARDIPEENIRIEGIAINLDLYNKMANIKHFPNLIF